MKKFLAVFCLLLCAATLQAKDKPDPAEFNIKIHVSASQVIFTPPFITVIDTVLNGNKVRLAGYLGGNNLVNSHSVIDPGDYHIRLKDDKSEHNGSVIRQGYELLLPDGDVWECYIVGISE